jgi:hypothetical protein
LEGSNLQFRFWDFPESRAMLPFAVTEGTARPKRHEVDEVEGSVPGAAREDHQHEARAGAARQDRLELARRYSVKGRPGIETRFVLGLLTAEIASDHMGNSSARMTCSA